jgi:radical SAM protein with 4Fe4S-binding SPASM domain
LFFQYYLSIWKKKTKLSAKPLSLSIEPTNICNLHCPECLTGNGKLFREKGKIAQKDFEQILDEVYTELCYLLLYFQGEPFLHPQFIEFIRYAKRKKVFVATSTNGHFLSAANAMSVVQSKLDLLIISLDGVTPDSYQKYRKGGNLHQVVSGIEELVKVKKKRKVNHPLIELQFIAFRHNEQEIEQFKELGKRLGVDKITVKSAQIYHLQPDAEIKPPENSRYSRYRQDKSGVYYPMIKKRKQCWRQWSGAVITWDGDVVPCCFDKNAVYKYGNWKTNGVYNLWEGKYANRFRTDLFQKKNIPEICINCPAL